MARLHRGAGVVVDRDFDALVDGVVACRKLLDGVWDTCGSEAALIELADAARCLAVVAERIAKLQQQETEHRTDDSVLPA